MKPYQRIKPPQVRLLNTALSALQKMGVAITKADIKARFEVKSTKDLTNFQFDEAMQHFEACGFVYQPKGKKTPMIRAAARIKQAYLAAIEKLLRDLGKDWPYAEGIARQMFSLERVVWQWLSPEYLHKVQVALIYQKGRQAGTPAPPQPGDPVERRRAAVPAAKRSADGEACSTGGACATAKRRRRNVGPKI